MKLASSQKKNEEEWKRLQIMDQVNISGVLLVDELNKRINQINNDSNILPSNNQKPSNQADRYNNTT